MAGTHLIPSVLAFIACCVCAVANAVDVDDCQDDFYCQLDIAREQCVHHQTGQASCVCVYSVDPSGKVGLQRKGITRKGKAHQNRPGILMRHRQGRQSSDIGMAVERLDNVDRSVSRHFRATYARVDSYPMGSGQLESTTVADNGSQTTATICEQRRENATKYGYCLEGELAFKLFWKKKEWSSARDRCLRDNARLLVLNDRTYDWLNTTSIIDQVQRKQQRKKPGRGPFLKSFFIGATDTKKEGHFMWTDGRDLKANSRMWRRGRPDDAVPGEDCAVLCVYRDHRYNLEDNTCTKKQAFICEISPCQ